MSMDDIVNNTDAAQQKPKRNVEYENLQRQIEKNQAKAPMSAAFKPEVKVLLASNSDFKLNDLSKILEVAGNVAQSPVRYQLIDYREVIDQQTFLEDKNSLSENALKKARTLKKLLKGQDFYVLADDSGLFIDQLPDQFGVKTARQLADAKLDVSASINQYLLDLLKGKEENQRNAHLETAVALIDASGREYQAIGRGGVKIANQERGVQSSGFDKIIETETGQTLAEIDDQQRFAFSQRGRAILNLLKTIDN